MKRSATFIVWIVLVCFAHSVYAGALKFQVEAKRATKSLPCPAPKIVPATAGYGALFSCIAGKAQTAKFFINEHEGTGQVKNIKLMWNDWFSDTGYGVHADKEEAQRFIIALAKLYVPGLERKLMSIFFSNTNTSIEAEGYQISYTYSRGSLIDERLFVLTPKTGLASQEPRHQGSTMNLNACKAAVSKAVGYSEQLLSGNDDPVLESEYKSFLIKGRGKDVFFCEVHPGRHYKIKAALNGKFPFKYIAEGTF